MMLTSTKPHELIRQQMEFIRMHASAFRLAAVEYEQAIFGEPDNDAKLDEIGDILGDAGSRLAQAVHNYRMVREIQGIG